MYWNKCDLFCTWYRKIAHFDIKHGLAHHQYLTSGFAPIPKVKGIEKTATPNIRFSVLCTERRYGATRKNKEYILLAEALSFESELERHWGMIGEVVTTAAKRILGNLPVQAEPVKIEKYILRKLDSYRSQASEWS